MVIVMEFVIGSTLALILLRILKIPTSSTFSKYTLTTWFAFICGLVSAIAFIAELGFRMGAYSVFSLISVAFGFATVVFAIGALGRYEHSRLIWAGLLLGLVPVVFWSVIAVRTLSGGA